MDCPVAFQIPEKKWCPSRRTLGSSPVRPSRYSALMLLLILKPEMTFRRADHSSRPAFEIALLKWQEWECPENEDSPSP
jgi:hypothetical protein